jgi:hypothetical protein
MDHHGWHVIDADAGVLWREYKFRRESLATMLVFRGKTGLVVVSPGCGLSAADYDALKEFGDVRALVANNTFHNLGQAPWRAHFKDAVSYAPPRAVAALDKKTPGIVYRPLSELELPASVHWEDPPGFKSGEAIFSVATKKGSVWYTGDLLTNIAKLPPPPLKWLFTWTGSAPGYRLFRLAVWFFVNDKQALKAWMGERLAKDPPSVIVPAHGVPVEGGEVAAQTREQIERI